MLLMCLPQILVSAYSKILWKIPLNVVDRTREMLPSGSDYNNTSSLHHSILGGKWKQVTWQEVVSRRMIVFDLLWALSLVDMLLSVSLLCLQGFFSVILLLSPCNWWWQYCRPGLSWTTCGVNHLSKQAVCVWKAVCTRWDNPSPENAVEAYKELAEGDNVIMDSSFIS